MASFEALQDRLAALQETTGQLKELIERLATLKFQPGSVPMSSSFSSFDDKASEKNGEGGSGNNVAAELSTEISQVLREEEEDLELLQEEIIDLRAGRETEHNKARLKEGAQRLEGELKRCRTSFRRAQLAARRSMESAQKLERELLLASYVATASVGLQKEQQQQQSNTSGGGGEQKRLFTARDRRRIREKGAASGTNRDVVDASSDVTEALRRTHALVAGEVAKSASAAQTLALSSAALKELEQTYEGVDTLLARSTALLGTLLAGQKSDTWYLRQAFRMLLFTLAWLVFRRFLYGPLWWVLWLPLRTSWRAGKAVSNNLASSSPPSSSSSSGARMEVHSPGQEDGSRVVGMAEEGAVPTVQVMDHRGKASRGDGGDPDSMVEKVARIIEDNLPPDEQEEELDDARRAAAENLTNSEAEKNLPNPMKRMWEEGEAPPSKEPDRFRDEL
ncbi:hypothetical protein B0H63DRAFT_460558 [Podospora didyma]|uniref:Sec20 C-terminal domain-containing protein n=1 Tax=Podospora didyma TaxID=330526 RepID=A0AAE0P6Q3_9PEZI|nr:hypothetical protein B0H63DRAFT_460558 [Podospora didyma]